MTDPHQPGARPWLVLADDEIAPTIVRSESPHLVVWSSIWPDRPDDEIHFAIGPSGDGSTLRWTVLTPGEAPDEGRLQRLRYRLNVIINAELRFSYGQ